MNEAQFMGMLVFALATLIGLFAVVYKPLSKNTEAMTKLTMKMEEFTRRMDERDREFREHKQEFDNYKTEHEKEHENYKERIREGQKRQWDKIDELSDDMIKVKHNCGMEGGNKGV